MVRRNCYGRWKNPIPIPYPTGVLPESPKQKQFRDDLYFKISMLCLELPPLARRGDDVLTIAYGHLGDQFTLDKKVVEAFQTYSWPGNIRELIGVLEQACFNCKGSLIRTRDLPAEISRKLRGSSLALHLPTLKQLEAKHIRDTLEATLGNKKRSAEIFGFHVKRFTKKIALYGI